MKQQMKIKAGEYVLNSINTYIDTNGNYASVIRCNSGENNFAFLRVTQEGVVLSLKGFKNESSAFKALNKQALKEDWKLFDTIDID